MNLLTTRTFSGTALHTNALLAQALSAFAYGLFGYA